MIESKKILGKIGMRLLIQRVLQAEVVVDQVSVGKINKGLLIFLGVSQQDGKESCSYLAEKAACLRIFSDKEEKMNLSLKDIQGEVLIVSQFTLYADCSSSRRPSFTEAADGKLAKELYECFILEMKARISKVETGVFGAYMHVHLINDGPGTFIIDSKLKIP